MVQIKNIAGEVIAQSQNLRGIITYANRANTFVVQVTITRLPTGEGSLSVQWNNEATCTTRFANYEVLHNWCKNRREWPAPLKLAY